MKEKEEKLTPAPKSGGAGPIGPNAPLDAQGYPQAPQTPVIGPAGPGTAPGNIVWTPSGRPTVPPLLPVMPLDL